MTARGLTAAGFAIGAAGAATWRAKRVQRAVHVLRGRPLMYGISLGVQGAMEMIGQDNVRIDSCDFYPTTDL